MRENLDDTGMLKSTYFRVIDLTLGAGFNPISQVLSLYQR